MRKIPTLFQRDFSPSSGGKYVSPEPHPDCEWVLDGEGVATRKWDGTCVKISYTGSVMQVHTRREVKPGQVAPDDFVLEDTDSTTGKMQGWVPLASSSWGRLVAQALDTQSVWEAGTYELCGPKVNGNPEGFDRHLLIPHGKHVLMDVPRSFSGLWHFLLQDALGIEGIVFYRANGQMAKIKARDFR